jgi:putative ABC transport system substrate-binding protein
VKRREFITLLGGAAAWPVVADAQQSKLWRIGWLHSGIENPKLTDAFMQGLREAGLLESQSITLDRRYAEGRPERLDALAAELVALKPDLIVAIATPAVAAAQRATSVIPIVMCPATDPVGSGFVKGLAHPGGNITGVANMFSDVTGKCVEILHSLVPQAKRIGVLMSLNPSHRTQFNEVQRACSSLGIATLPITAATPSDLPDAFERIGQSLCDAVFVAADPPRREIVALAAITKIPTMYQFREYVEFGGLMSYGASNAALFKKASDYVGQIIRGANPAELPVQQPTFFELVINLTTARALGLTVPPTLLARADEVIE